MSTLDGRDRAVVQLVARFKQLSSRQISDVLFPNNSSHTPLDRTLRRLTDDKYLSRIERRIVGGSRGGSGQFVYQLGRRGFYLHFTGRYQPVRSVSYHCLAVADCFIQLRKLEREGRLSIVGLSTEPDCWREVGGVQLKPDMYVELKRAGQLVKLWFEVDMGTEAQRQLRGKLEAYWRAYNEADASQIFPRTVWVAVDDERGKELRWLLSQGSADARKLFTVTTAANLSEHLWTTEP